MQTTFAKSERPDVGFSADPDRLSGFQNLMQRESLAISWPQPKPPAELLLAAADPADPVLPATSGTSEL
jgi:hypothetical protein